MKRWKLRLLWAGLAVSGLIGCKSQLFQRECEHDYYRAQALKLGALPNLEADKAATVEPGTYNIAKPQTVDQPDRPARHLSLQEAISIALEQGTTGFLTLGGGLGQANENIQSGRGGTFSDSIRVLAYDPAIAGADIEASLAKFDTRWISSQNWSKRDDAPINALTNFQNGDSYNLTSGLFKPTATGGVAGITYSMDYLLAQNNNGFFINPSWRPRLQFQFEQPLLQNYGVEINQLLVNHPGSTQIPRFRAPGGGRVEGILVTRVRYEQAKAELERNINHMLLNVEAAYWNLWAAYGTLKARNDSVVEAYNIWRQINDRVIAGVNVKLEEQRSRTQLEQFRGARILALGDVIERERQLRLLLGLPNDGTRLVPIDTPTLAPFEPDWQAAVGETLNNRPELVQARQDLKVRQFDILLQKNLLKPDVRFVANYDVNGVGDRLDGQTRDAAGDFNNALGVMALNKFNSWQFGLQLDVPIGFRDAHSALRVSRLNLLRSYASLRDNERKAIAQLQDAYSRLSEYQRTMQAQHSQRYYSAQWLKSSIIRRDIEQGTAPLENILSAQRSLSEAEAAEFRAVADYNITLARFQFSKGTIMQYDNVAIGEGALPECAQVRATEHFRERTAAIVTRERDTQTDAPTGVVNIERDPLAEVMPVPVETPPSVLHMMNSGPRPLGTAAPLPNGGNGSVPSRIPPADLLPTFGSQPVARPAVEPWPTTPVQR